MNLKNSACHFQKLCIILLLFFVACKKEDPQPDKTNTSASLSSGRAGITFNTDTEFGGSTGFSIKNTGLTTATAMALGSSKRSMILKAEETFGGFADTRKATMYVLVPVSATLPFTIDLSLPLSTNPSAQLEFYETTAGFGTTYRSASGQLHVTKLTATEVEGNFSGIVTEAGGGSSYTVTNGTFAAKF